MPYVGKKYRPPKRKSHCYGKKGSLPDHRWKWGLAKIIIHEIALHIQRGVVILVGRSQPTKDMQQWLNEWQQSELKVIYRSLDVTDRQAVQRCIKDIKATYGDLNGIIHGAGVTDDHFMIQKSNAIYAGTGTKSSGCGASG
ncbi:SDR family NAD(P)-dependent oxidoreductase [Bacillus inaquosorum]|nr:SDR family NAD(P)-dependent oxidoreductase [Bacillus inaquosorum]